MKLRWFVMLISSQIFATSIQSETTISHFSNHLALLVYSLADRHIRIPDDGQLMGVANHYCCYGMLSQVALLLLWNAVPSSAAISCTPHHKQSVHAWLLMSDWSS